MARIPPTLVAFTETAWNTTGTTKNTASVSWQAGDVITVIGGSASEGTTLGTPTATGLTFAANGTAVNAAGSCWGHKWTATAAGSGSSAVTQTASNSVQPWGIAVWVWRGSDGIGNAAAPAGSTAQTASLTRSQDESAVVEGVFDWGAGAVADLTSEWTPTPDNIREASTVAGEYTVGVADWLDQGTAGTTSYGVNVTASGQNYTKIALEVLGAEDPTPPEVGIPQGVLRKVPRGIRIKR